MCSHQMPVHEHCRILHKPYHLHIWTLLAAGDGFQWMRYVAVLGTSVPVTIEYCVSNVIFLWILTPVFVKKLNRVKYKYGFFKDEEVRKQSINET